MSLFHSRYDDFQVQQFQDLGGGATAVSIQNAAEVTTKGMELDFAAKLSKNLKIDAAASLLYAKFDKFPGGGRNGPDASGNDLPFAPDFTTNIGLEYVFPVDRIDARLMLRGDYFHSEGFYTDASNVKYLDNSVRDYLGVVVAVRGMPRTYGIGFKYAF